MEKKSFRKQQEENLEPSAPPIYPNVEKFNSSFQTPTNNSESSFIPPQSEFFFNQGVPSGFFPPQQQPQPQQQQSQSIFSAIFKPKNKVTQFSVAKHSIEMYKNIVLYMENFGIGLAELNEKQILMENSQISEGTSTGNLEMNRIHPTTVVQLLDVETLPNNEEFIACFFPKWGIGQWFHSKWKKILPVKFANPGSIEKKDENEEENEKEEFGDENEEEEKNSKNKKKSKKQKKEKKKKEFCQVTSLKAAITKLGNCVVASFKQWGIGIYVNGEWQQILDTNNIEKHFSVFEVVDKSKFEFEIQEMAVASSYNTDYPYILVNILQKDITEEGIESMSNFMAVFLGAGKWIKIPHPQYETENISNFSYSLIDICSSLDHEPIIVSYIKSFGISRYHLSDNYNPELKNGYWEKLYGPCSIKHLSVTCGKETEAFPIIIANLKNCGVFVFCQIAQNRIWKKVLEKEIGNSCVNLAVSAGNDSSFYIIGYDEKIGIFSEKFQDKYLRE